MTLLALPEISEFEASSRLAEIYESSGFFMAAAQCWGQAVRGQPVNDQVWARLFSASKRANCLEDLVCLAQELRRAQPYSWAPVLWLARGQSGLFDIDGATVTLENGCVSCGDLPILLYELANVYHLAGRYPESLATFRRLYQLAPRDEAGRLGLSISLLRHGRFEEGWAAYEARLACPHSVSKRDPPEFAWRGENLGGASLLVRSEQGRGDIIQAARWLRVMPAEQPVIFETHADLVPLFHDYLGIEVVQRGQPLPPYRRSCGIMSLPHLLELGSEAPQCVPYMSAPPERISRWREIVPARQELMVGLVWAGSPLNSVDDVRSIPIEAAVSLLDVPRTHFYVMQKGVDEGQITMRTAPSAPLTELAPFIQDFGDTAAALQFMDILITVDTSIAHLAGALGVETWLLNRRHPHWPWMCEGENTPWYKTIRQFRQTRTGVWTDVLQAVRQELALRARKCTRSDSQRPPSEFA